MQGQSIRRKKNSKFLRLRSTVKSALRIVDIMTPAERRLRQQAMDMYRQFVRRGDLVFDVGANVGSRVDAFVQLGAWVVAIEPQAECLRYLRLRYGWRPNVRILPYGLDEKEGEREFFLSKVSKVSSMSSEWIHNFSQQGGKARLENWDRTTTVRVTTLDALIAQFGKPQFCKIDTEGFDYQVLKGLSEPISALSFEYTPRFIQPALDSVAYLSRMGDFEFNYSVLETMILALPGWVRAEEMQSILTTNLAGNNKRSGDVYARLPTGSHETNG